MKRNWADMAGTRYELATTVLPMLGFDPSGAYAPTTRAAANSNRTSARPGAHNSQLVGCLPRASVAYCTS